MDWNLTFETYAVGDEAWIYVGNHQGDRSKGTVIAALDLPGYSMLHYVVEIPTHIEPLLEIRTGNGLEMRRHP